jgi:hypothetical protein
MEQYVPEMEQQSNRDGASLTFSADFADLSSRVDLPADRLTAESPKRPGAWI